MRPIAAFLLCVTAVPLIASDRVEEWRSDLAALKTQLQEVHPRFRTCGLPADLEARFATLTQEVDKRTDNEIVVDVQRLLASVGDGHTLLFPFGMKRGVLRRAPIKLWWFEEGLFVVEGEEQRYVG